VVRDGRKGKRGPPWPGTHEKGGAARRGKKRTKREARPAVATNGRKGRRCQQNEMGGIPLLESMMKIYAADTLICCNMYPCRMNCSVRRHGMMHGDCPFLT